MIDRFILWLARVRGIPLGIPMRMTLVPDGLIEVDPVTADTFVGLNHNIQSMPTLMDWDTVAKGMWPRPDRRYRVFVTRAE